MFEITVGFRKYMYIFSTACLHFAYRTAPVPSVIIRARAISNMSIQTVTWCALYIMYCLLMCTLLTLKFMRSIFHDYILNFHPVNNTISLCILLLPSASRCWIIRRAAVWASRRTRSADKAAYCWPAPTRPIRETTRAFPDREPLQPRSPSTS